MRHMIVIAALVAFYCGWLTAVGSASTSLTLIKVAYLYNFAKFIEWPPEALGEAHTSFVICMLGTDMTEGALPTLQGKSLKGKKVMVKYFARATDVQPEACRILFVSTSERDRIHRIITLLAKRPVLTVGDAKGFAQQGRQGASGQFIPVTTHPLSPQGRYMHTRNVSLFGNAHTAFEQSAVGKAAVKAIRYALLRALEQFDREGW